MKMLSHIPKKILLPLISTLLLFFPLYSFSGLLPHQIKELTTQGITLESLSNFSKDWSWVPDFDQLTVEDYINLKDLIHLYDPINLEVWDEDKVMLPSITNNPRLFSLLQLKEEANSMMARDQNPLRLKDVGLALKINFSIYWDNFYAIEDLLNSFSPHPDLVKMQELFQVVPSLNSSTEEFNGLINFKKKWGRDLSLDQIIDLSKAGVNFAKVNIFVDIYPRPITLDDLKEISKDNINLLAIAKFANIWKDPISLQEIISLRKINPQAFDLTNIQYEENFKKMHVIWENEYNLEDFKFFLSLSGNKTPPWEAINDLKSAFGKDLTLNLVFKWVYDNVRLDELAHLKKAYGDEVTLEVLKKVIVDKPHIFNLVYWKNIYKSSNTNLSLGEAQFIMDHNVLPISWSTMGPLWKKLPSADQLIQLDRQNLNFYQLMNLLEFDPAITPIQALEFTKLGIHIGSLLKLSPIFNNLTWDKISPVLSLGADPLEIWELKLIFPKITLSEIENFLKVKGIIQDFLNFMKNNNLSAREFNDSEKMYFTYKKNLDLSPPTFDLSTILPAPGDQSCVNRSDFDELIRCFTTNTIPLLTLQAQLNAFEFYRLSHFGNPKTELPKDIHKRIAQVQSDYPNLTKIAFAPIEYTAASKYYPHEKEVLVPIFNMLEQEKDKIISMTNPPRAKALAQAMGVDAYHFERIFPSTLLTSLKKSRKFTKGKDLAFATAFREIFHNGLYIMNLPQGLTPDPAKTKKLTQFLLNTLTLSFLFDSQIQEDQKKGHLLASLEKMLKLRDDEIHKNHWDDLFSHDGLHASLHTSLLQAKKEEQWRPHGEKLIVRPLSLIESAFRSCLGATDCSSRTYLEKALQPNYFYFTQTNNENESQGQITVVLGTAEGNAQDMPVAFVDKIQNIPHAQLSMVLEAIRLSVEQKNYQLSIPLDLGHENGITNSIHTRSFIQNSLPTYNQQTLVWKNFSPIATTPVFPNAYSRADSKLHVRPLLPLKGGDQEYIFRPLPALPQCYLQQGDEKKLETIAKTFPHYKNGNLKDKITYLYLMEAMEVSSPENLDPQFQEIIQNWVQSPKTPIKLKNEVMSMHLRSNNKKQLIEGWRYLSLSERQALMNTWRQSETYREHLIELDKN